MMVSYDHGSKDIGIHITKFMRHGIAVWKSFFLTLQSLGLSGCGVVAIVAFLQNKS
jgi:hypothetical protein